MRLSFAAAALVCLLLVSCNRPGPASAEYAEAREKWSALVQEKLDQAAFDPRADEVLRLLRSVDAKSIDAPFAAELKAEIEKARKEHDAAAQAQAQALQAAEASLKQAIRFEPENKGGDEPEPEVKPVAAAAPDAGAEPSQPEEGMDATEFRTRFARCYEYKNDSLVGGLAGGQVWGLKDLSICRDLHAGLVGKSVLLYEGKVAAIRPNEELAPKKYVVVNGTLVPVEEAERLQKEAAAKAAAQATPTAP